MPRPPWVSDVLIVSIFALILAVLSVVNISTLQQTYDQNERLRTVNQFVDCLDPTTKCGSKLAAYQAAEQEFLINSMRSQAVCTLLTARSVQEEHDITALERVYNDCVVARAEPPPEPPESPLEEEEDD